MGQPPPQERLLAIIETQNEIAASALDLDAVMMLIARRAQELVGADAAALELPEDHEMVYRAASGIAEPLLGLRLPLKDSFSGQCLQSGENLNCTDSSQDSRVNREACRRMGAVSILCIPIRRVIRPVGVLTVYSGARDAFQDTDERTLELLAGAVAAHLIHADQVPSAAKESLHDVLTGLPNRRAFEQRLGSEVARIRRHGGALALCLIDLDDFQEVNDTLGHPVGDEVLRAVARRLGRIRGEDIAFRIGGDEFAVIFSGIDETGARKAVRRLESGILADPGCGGVEISWAVAELDSGDPAELIASAKAELRHTQRGRRHSKDSFWSDS
jgi:diguanylate cyclase (GGDEF)-like protein